MPNNCKQMLVMSLESTEFKQTHFFANSVNSRKHPIWMFLSKHPIWMFFGPLGSCVPATGKTAASGASELLSASEDVSVRARLPAYAIGSNSKNAHCHAHFISQLFLEPKWIWHIYICMHMGWLRPGNRFVSFVRARGLVARWNSSSNPGREFSLFPFGPLSFPFSLVWQGVFPPPPPNLLSNFSWPYRYMECGTIAW